MSSDWMGWRVWSPLQVGVRDRQGVGASFFRPLQCSPRQSARQAALGRDLRPVHMGRFGAPPKKSRLS